MPSYLALVISDLSAGGAQKVLTTLASNLAHQGHAVTVITLSGTDEDHFLLDDQVHRIAINALGQSRGLLPAIAANFRRIQALRVAIKRCKAPLIVAFLAETNILVMLATIGLRRRVVISERNSPSRQPLGGIWNFLRRRLYRYADVVTANSRDALEDLAAFVPAAKLALAPNPPPQLPKSTPDDRYDGRTILNVGRLHTQKAQDILIQAFARMDDAWHLVIVGEGEERDELEKLAKTLGIANRIEFAGRQSDLEPYYRAATIFALPSRYEGTPNALLEAMAYGIPPVVAESTSGALDYVVENVTGLVVPANDVDALATELNRLAGDLSLRRRIGAEARSKLAEQDVDATMAVWESLLGLTCCATVIKS